MGILGSILGGILAPFTGGASAFIGPLSDVLSGAAGTSAKQNEVNDRNTIDLLNARTAREKAALAAPGSRLSTAIRAALTQSATPAQVHWGGPGSGLRGEVPTFTGGSNSIYQAVQNPDVKNLSSRITADELMSQMKGGPTGGNQDMDLGSAANAGQESLFDKILGGSALGAGLLGAIQKGRGVKPPQVPDVSIPYGPPDIYGDE